MQAMTTRMLRLWHWRRCVSARESAGAWPGDCSTSKRNHKLADFHISAVQALNDCPDCIATTAEHDDAIFPKPHSTKSKR